jgi:hypothetical protein
MKLNPYNDFSLKLWKRKLQNRNNLNYTLTASEQYELEYDKKIVVFTSYYTSIEFRGLLCKFSDPIHQETILHVIRENNNYYAVHTQKLKNYKNSTFLFSIRFIRECDITKKYFSKERIEMLTHNIFYEKFRHTHTTYDERQGKILGTGLIVDCRYLHVSRTLAEWKDTLERNIRDINSICEQRQAEEDGFMIITTYDGVNLNVYGKCWDVDRNVIKDYIEIKFHRKNPLYWLDKDYWIISLKDKNIPFENYESHSESCDRICHGIIFKADDLANLIDRNSKICTN